MLSKKPKMGTGSRPEPPNLDSIHQDIESSPPDDVAFSFFWRQSQTQLDESATSLDIRQPVDESAETGLRRRIGDPTTKNLVPGGVSSAFSNVMAAASDAIHKQKISESSNSDPLGDGDRCIEAEETYRKVLDFIEANRKLQVMVGKQDAEKFDQSFESIGEGREDFMDPLEDDDDNELFKDEDSVAATSIGALGGDTIAECDDYLPRDEQDNFKQLVHKLDSLKKELSRELAELCEKTS